MVVQLIAKDKQEKLQYEGRCKLMIDAVSYLLLVEPVNEEYKMISAVFKWKFVAQKNILFVFAEYDFQDFALIFDDPNKCKKIYKILIKKEATSGNKKLIHERFLPELFTEISEKPESNFTMKEILLNWIELHVGKEKEEYIQICKNNKIYDLIFSCVKDVRSNLNPRKRKGQDCFYKKNKSDKNNEFDAKRSNVNLKKIIEYPNFNAFKYVQNGQSRTKLSIFPTSERKYCYEYFLNKSKRYFVCHACQFRKKHVSAKFVKRNGKDVVMLNGTQHVCEMREYKQIVEKPNFEVISLDQTINKGLILFFDSSRINCYEYSCDSHCKTYYCCGCTSKKLKNGANICQKEDGTEFVMLKSSNHVCEPRKYNPEKYGEKEIVEADNFKIFNVCRDGKEKSKLVIFAKTDKSTCYEYFWDNIQKKFLCCGCNSKKNKKNVTAELCKHDDGSNYLKLNKKKHVCEPREFQPKKFDITKKEIVESSNFKVFHFQHNGKPTSKLVVFCPTNKNLCYEYFWHQRLQLYRCSNCPFRNQVNATVCQKEGFKYSLTQHVCDLLEFNPEKYKDDVIVKKEMYKITSSDLDRTKNKILVIFTNEEKRFYYKFVYHNQRKFYYCSKCYSSFKTLITAIIENEGKENECVFLSNQKHICESIEYSLFDENYVFKSPNFQLIKRKFRGNIIQHMVVFTNDDKTECYEYTWNDKLKNFRCYACINSHNIYVYARIFQNDENEECIELCKNEHQCKPIKFVPENISSKIVKEPDFKLYEILYQGKNIKKLTIFDCKDKNYGYVYTYNDNIKKYICPRCTMKCKSVTATIKQQENSQNYVELNNIEHVCELQKL